ncbi:hypothetical protein H5410_012904 [Solanum commersonii]|uniref:Uncharacterized protein n=1 Tax=Solanum commersonii TaxID=4109 RepID=A0A9J6ASZ6_SOLCO|nr:hypothetical protein H5410_012904 [Solanum commersonii]
MRVETTMHCQKKVWIRGDIILINPDKCMGPSVPRKLILPVQERGRGCRPPFSTLPAYHKIMVGYVRVDLHSLGNVKYYERFDVQLEEREEETTMDLECGSACINVGSMKKEIEAPLKE